MYLSPPSSNLQEFIERLDNHEVFRVFKRIVNKNTKDRTFKRHGRSTIMLEDGTEVIVQILNGRIIRVEELGTATEGFHTTHTKEPRMKLSPKEIKAELNFKSLLDAMNDAEKNWRGDPKPDNNDDDKTPENET